MTKDKNESTEKDWFLQMLVKMVNKDNLAVGITLTSHGLLISGNLAGGREYFADFGQELETAIGTSSNVKEVFTQLGEKTYSENNNGNDPEKPVYIHLKDAKFFHPNGNPIPTNRGVWWRGRIAEISGFTLGKLNVE